jgi:hypothetical protein
MSDTESIESTGADAGLKKSELVRQIQAENPGIRAGEIVSKAAEAGVVVSLPLVYQAMRGASGAPKKKARARRGEGSGVKQTKAAEEMRPSSNGSKITEKVDFDDLLKAMQKYVQAAGGVEKAISILKMFKE